MASFLQGHQGEGPTEPSIRLVPDLILKSQSLGVPRWRTSSGITDISWKAQGASRRETKEVTFGNTCRMLDIGRRCFLKSSKETLENAELLPGFESVTQAAFTLWLESVSKALLPCSSGGCYCESAPTPDGKNLMGPIFSVSQNTLVFYLVCQLTSQTPPLSTNGGKPDMGAE